MFRAVLNDDDIHMHGEGVLRAVSRLLSQKDVGLKELLDTWADENEVMKLSVFLLNYYTGLRGKDFVRKQNAQVVRTGETHRATIGVIHDLKKKEHANARSSEKDSNEEHEEDGGGDEEDSPSMTMVKDQLVALCKQYGLPRSGNKTQLLERIRKHMQTKKDKDQSNELESEDADGVESDDEDEEAARDKIETEVYETIYGEEEEEQEYNE